MQCSHPNLELLAFCNRFFCRACGRAFTLEEAKGVFAALKKIADHNYSMVHAQEQHIDSFYETR